MDDEQGAESGDLLPIGEVVGRLGREFPDVTHSSLRFLEREGLISPPRTPGGHRAFRPGDIERIRKIKTWQAQRRSLAEIRARLAAPSTDATPAEIATAFVERAIDGRTAAAVDLILNADDQGMPLQRLFDDVLRPALHEIGRQWEARSLLVAQEKEVSELARDLIAELSRRHAAPDPNGPVAVAACVPGERHELGLRMVTGLLRAHGWRVHVLGADTAPAFLAEAVRLREPRAVLLSATISARLLAVHAAIDAVRAAAPPDRIPVIVVGGQGVSDHTGPLSARGVISTSEFAWKDVLDSVTVD